MAFVHLHNHTDYSLLRGASPVERLVDRARAIEMPALAITDDGNLFGALAFYHACRTAGIRPIIGCDFFVAPESRERRTALDGPNRNGRVVLLARNREGYANLIALSSIGYTEGFYYRPRIDHEVMERHAAGLILLTGSIGGEIPRLLLANRLDEARALLGWYREVYGAENVYLEVTDHGMAEQRALRELLLTLAGETGTPLVAANDTYYVEREDANAQDILMCIGSNRKKAETNRFRFSSDEFYLKSEAEMRERFGEIPGAIENTVAITERCDLEIDLPGPRFPDYHIPAQFPDKAAYLRHLTMEGLAERYRPISEEIARRAEYELDTIISMGFVGYFLIVWDFIKFARDRDIPVGPGRGSGAGSIVAYALKITDIDPLKYGLLFERFLNPERVSMPDFDIDFCFERRGEVIEYVTGKYGRDKVGQIITFGTLKTKLVIRDVARVLGLEYEEADAIAKLVPRDLKITLEKAIEQVDELRALPERGAVYAELIDVSRRLEGLHRHASTHAAGLVIGEHDLTSYVPLYRDPRTGSISTQFTMDQLEECGLVKMDFLGLKTLTLIRNTEILIRRREPEFRIDAVSDTDPATFAMLSRGESEAVFQFENPAMMDVLRRAKPNRIEDLIALTSLFRPGPMQFVDQFIDSKNGRIEVSYPLPALEPILRETYGVIVYQEQVMEIARVVGGFSLGKADILRRAMGKKKEKEMARMEAEFISGAEQKGYTADQATEIFELLKPFAGYGFNKSHAAAYSVLAYQTAYLKANYPVEFMAANLTNEINSSEKFAEYLRVADRMGITVRAPHVNTSQKVFSVLDGEIVFGMVGIKNVGSGAVDAILAAREAGGAFRSLEDLLARVDPQAVNKKVIETLVQVGALDGLGHTRATLTANLDVLLEVAARERVRRDSGQVDLFGGDAEAAPIIEEHEEWSAAERLAFERDLLGAYFSGHPLDDYRDDWRSRTTLHLGRLEQATTGQSVQLVALLRSLRTVVTKRGERMAVGVLEDYNGEIECVAFPEVFRQIDQGLVANSVLGVVGKLDRRNESFQLVLEELKALDELDEKDATAVHIRLANEALSEEALLHLRGDLQELSGSSDVILHLSENGDAPMVRTSALRVSSKREALGRIRQHPLVREVWKS